MKIMMTGEKGLIGTYLKKRLEKEAKKGKAEVILTKDVEVIEEPIVPTVVNEVVEPTSKIVPQAQVAFVFISYFGCMSFFMLFFFKLYKARPFFNPAKLSSAHFTRAGLIGTLRRS